MPSISFKSVVRNNMVEIPQEYRGDFISPVSVTIAYEQSVRQHMPNIKTIAAMQEAKEIEDDLSVKAYSSVDELFADLDAACTK
jgi:hypothetical protein